MMRKVQKQVVKQLHNGLMFGVSKDLRFGTECRQKMLEGCDKLADAV